MGKYNLKKTDTNLRLGEVRFSFVHVFEKRVGDDGKEGKEGKYGCCILWPKSDTNTTEMVQAAIEAAKQKGKTDKWNGKIPANCKSPLRDGDIDREDDENFEGMWFMNANAGQKPGIRVLENGRITEALPDDFYSGCWGAVTVNFYPYEFSGNKGVGVGLNNVMKTRDDTKLSGGASAESDFGDLGDFADSCLD